MDNVVFRISEIRNKLKEHLPYEKAVLLRNELNEIANAIYIQKYSDTDYIDFIDKYEAVFSRVHVQDTNNRHYITMFTVPTQHVSADNIRQVLDIGLDFIKNRKQ